MEYIDELIKKTAAYDLSVSETTKIVLFHMIDYSLQEICLSTNETKISFDECKQKIQAFCPSYFKVLSSFCKSPTTSNLQFLLTDFICKPYQITNDALNAIAFMIEFICIECLESSCFFGETITPSILKQTINNHQQLNSCFKHFYWIH